MLKFAEFGEGHVQHLIELGGFKCPTASETTVDRSVAAKSASVACRVSSIDTRKKFPESVKKTKKDDPESVKTT